MINYSLVARPTKPGDADSPKKIYAAWQSNHNIDLQQFSKHIASHGSPFSAGTIAGIINDASSCLRELLLDGYQIQLGELGTFYLTLSSAPSDATEEFTTSQIKDVNVRWRKGDAFENLTSEAHFNYVPTRLKQAEAKREEKESIDIEVGAPTNNSGSGNSTGGNTGGNSGGGGNDDNAEGQTE